uniref:BZIP domain-containing protein n=2 Tax=Caenorhabditis tropicalis TaxID=1561998 RepID=A0A1I7TMY8_9PELO
MYPPNSHYSHFHHQPQVFYNQFPSQQPFYNDQFHTYQQPATHEVPPDPFSSIEPMETDVQPKEKILEEIVRECEEIERRSNSSGSPVSNWSSDERDTPSEKSYHPYKTPEKKERKKAQNRLAATRYREKKRREKEEAMTCIEGLTVTNSKLKDQVSELEREIRYFKKFMTEMGMKNAELRA